MILRRFPVRSLLAPAAAIFLACTSPAPEGAAPPAGQGVEVAISPTEATVAQAGTVAFGATVTGTANTEVTWTIAPAGCGSVSPGGLYTAPAGAATCQVLATSDADPTRSAAATVTVTAAPPPPPPPPPPPVVALQIAPASAEASGCESVPFTATVTGTTNTAVTWSVQEGAAGGSITAGGVYTAPQDPGTYHAVATSDADGSTAAVAEITVTERVLGVAISPTTITVPAGGTAEFTATVTTTCGSFASMKTLSATADGVITAN